MVDDDGMVHVAWHDHTDYGGSGSDPDIFYKYKPAGGSWSTTEVVSTESISFSEQSSLMVDGDGTVHVAWHDWTDYGGSGSDRDIFYKICQINQSPELPSTPTGPDEGIIEIEYSFETVTTDPEGDEISYMFDWGDGNYSDWSGYVASGTPSQGSHAWDKLGTYEVKAKAKDTNGLESDWSDPHIITITILGGPLLDIDIISGGLFRVSTKIKNIGEIEAVNVTWNISLDGNFILLGRKTTGIIESIPAGEGVTIYSKVITGFGKTAITATAEIPESSDTRQQSAFVLLFFTKVNP